MSRLLEFDDRIRDEYIRKLHAPYAALAAERDARNLTMR
jgi:hypothetical protein